MEIARSLKSYLLVLSACPLIQYVPIPLGMFGKYSTPVGIEQPGGAGVVRMEGSARDLSHSIVRSIYYDMHVDPLSLLP